MREFNAPEGKLDDSKRRPGEGFAVTSAARFSPAPITRECAPMRGYRLETRRMLNSVRAIVRPSILKPPPPGCSGICPFAELAASQEVSSETVAVAKSQ